MSRSVVVRCDGSPEIGLGHVVRCLALARVLRDKHDCEVSFAVRRGPLGVRMIREDGFVVTQASLATGPEYREWMSNSIESTGADALVLDVRDDLTFGDVKAIRERRALRVAVIDDGSDRRLAADAAFYPPVPQVERLEWSDSECEVFVGWQWVLLRPEFAVEPHRGASQPPVILVAMGGSDPSGLTPKVLRALALVGQPIECVALLGPGFLHDSECEAALDGFPHEHTLVRDGDIREIMIRADLGVLSFGMTAYEAAACALPAVHLCLTEDHALSSSAFADAGIAVSVGLAEDMVEARLIGTIEGLLAEEERLRAMGQRARCLVDGNGAARIAGVIAGWGSK